MPNDDAIGAFWERCRALRPQWSEPDFPMPEAWWFGADPEMADRLGGLVVAGVKTATSSAVCEYEHNGEALPVVGELGIVHDGRGEPLCLIETTQVRVFPFDEVPGDHAYAEAEGDRSLDAWRQAHWDFFSRFLPTLGLEPARDMSIVCEEFRVVARAAEVGPE